MDRLKRQKLNDIVLRYFCERPNVEINYYDMARDLGIDNETCQSIVMYLHSIGYLIHVRQGSIIYIISPMGLNFSQTDSFEQKAVDENDMLRNTKWSKYYALISVIIGLVALLVSIISLMGFTLQ